ncbi:hypothetical protein [Phocaeicola vulgatus]|jgi:hypothetical protein|uniref:hypothetical protein n=1 Tax=Phocaeicola vulgatus TaxID=821 RepID=UPI003DA34C70
MDFDTIKKCIDALNKTAPFEIKIKQSRKAGCELYSSKDELTIIIGEYVEVLFYLYCYASKENFRKYLCQSIYARHSMYEKAFNVLNKLCKSQSLISNTLAKIKQLTNNKLLNNLTLLSIFHEIGHIVFSVDDNVKVSYYEDISNRLKSLDLSILFNEEHDLLSNQIQLGYNMASNNVMNTTEEIACDCYAIDVIFKLKMICNFSTKQVLNYCLDAIELLTCTYQVEFLNRTSHNDHNGIFEDVLAKFCIRRMIVFDRMREILSTEYNIDDYVFDKLCRKIAPSITDMYELKLIAENMSVDTSQYNWRIKDKYYKDYLHCLNKFNANYTTQFCRL